MWVIHLKEDAIDPNLVPAAQTMLIIDEAAIEVLVE